MYCIFYTQVWFHGGRYNLGEASVPLYNGATLSSFTDVILVTLNYRLGMFGFMPLSDTGKSKGKCQRSHSSHCWSITVTISEPWIEIIQRLGDTQYIVCSTRSSDVKKLHPTRQKWQFRFFLYFFPPTCKKNNDLFINKSG